MRAIASPCAAAVTSLAKALHPLLLLLELIYADVTPPLSRFALPLLIDRHSRDVPSCEGTLRAHVELHPMEPAIDSRTHDLTSHCVKRDDSLRAKILESL
jgi:hypothetical protein